MSHAIREVIHPSPSEILSKTRPCHVFTVCLLMSGVEPDGALYLPCDGFTSLIKHGDAGCESPF